MKTKKKLSRSEVARTQGAKARLPMLDRMPEGTTEALRLVWVRPSELRENPLNWRSHTNRQRQTYSALKSQVGWAGAALLNERTGRIIDGHMRKQEAEKDGDALMPVLVGNWSEDQEKLILASLDPITAMAQTDEQALRSLTLANRTALKGLKTKDSKRLAKVNEELKAYAEQVSTGQSPRTMFSPQKKTEEFESEEDGEYPESEEPEEDDNDDEEQGFQPSEEDSSVFSKPELKDEVFFQGSTDWEIPDLLPEMLARPEDAPRITWDRSDETLREDALFCHSARRFLFKPPYADRSEMFHGGVTGFYTQDWRFEYVYEYPSDFSNLLLEEDWSAVISPDFSTYLDYPFPLNLWNIYRSRWCARYWQELGIRVIPSIQNIIEGLTLETLPVPCPVISMQCRTLDKKDPKAHKDFGKFVTLAVEYLKPEVVVIYGGMEHERKYHGYLPRGPEYRNLPSYTGIRKKKRKSVESKTLPAIGVSRPNNRANKVRRQES
jgi:hypothetical protein